jgi:pimeloyl-ACP methyl ester carboxylesterase
MALPAVILRSAVGDEESHPPCPAAIITTKTALGRSRRARPRGYGLCNTILDEILRCTQNDGGADIRLMSRPAAAVLKLNCQEEFVRISARALGALTLFCFSLAAPAYAKKYETGFLDRTVSVRGVTYKYQVFVPDTWTPHDKWPVILFLHGAGERGDDGLNQTDVGIGVAIRSNRSVFPSIVVMPQCEKNIWWIQSPMDDVAMATLDAASKEFHGDAHRTYLTGLSMGGYGSWHLAEKYPHRFAAMIVIAGGIIPPAPALKNTPGLADVTPPDQPQSYTAAAAKVGKVPVWIFHGADDDIVPVTESQRMAAAMKELGGEVRYTEFPGVRHPSWDKAYDEPKLFPWLFSKSLSAPTK